MRETSGNKVPLLLPSYLLTIYNALRVQIHAEQYTNKDKRWLLHSENLRDESVESSVHLSWNNYGHMTIAS